MSLRAPKRSTICGRNDFEPPPALLRKGFLSHAQAVGRRRGERERTNQEAAGGRAGGGGGRGGRGLTPTTEDLCGEGDGRPTREKKRHGENQHKHGVSFLHSNLHAQPTFIRGVNGGRAPPSLHRRHPPRWAHTIKPSPGHSSFQPRPLLGAGREPHSHARIGIGPALELTPPLSLVDRHTGATGRLP